MSDLRWTQLCTVWAVLISSAAPSSQPQRVEVSAVSGTVVEASQGLPVVGVTVRATSASLRVDQSVVSDSKGRFVFVALPPATDYTIQAVKPGYLPGGYGWTPDTAASDRAWLTIQLGAGVWRSDIVLRMWRSGTIAGTVSDEHGHAVVGVQVVPISTRRIAGYEHAISGPPATTDDRGFYRLDNVLPGSYKLCAVTGSSTVPGSVEIGSATRAIGQVDTGGTIAGVVGSAGVQRIALGDSNLLVKNLIPPPGSPDAAYVTTCYPGVTDIKDAKAIDAAFAEDIEGISFSLAPEPAFKVSGRIATAAPSGALVRLMRSGYEHLGFGFETATGIVESNGSFSLLGVPVGQYTVLVQSVVGEFFDGYRVPRMPVAPGFVTTGSSSGSFPGTPGLTYMSRATRALGWGIRQSLAVSGPVSGLVLNPANQLAVRGRIEVANGSVPIPRLTLQAEPANGDPSFGAGRVTSDEKGNFEISGLSAGRYVLRSYSSWVVEGLSIRGALMQDGAFEVSDLADLEGLVLRVRNDPGRLTGQVAVPAGEMRACVLLFPMDSRGWRDYGWTPTQIQVAPVQIGGSFEVGRVPAGEYFVIAVDSAHRNSWLDPRFLEAAAAHGQRVRVNWGQTLTVALPMRGVRK